MSPDARPFLPEAQVTPPPKKTSTSKKTLLQWVVLIVMFLAIWQFLSPETKSTQPQLPPCDSSGTGFSTLMMLAPFGLFVLCAWWFLRTYRQSVDFSLAQEPGRLAMAERRFADATDIFLRTADAHKKQPPYVATATRDVAFAQLWAGRLDEAIASYTRVEKAPGVLFSSGVRMLAATELALANAIAGDLETATRWADEARSRLAKNKDQRLLCAASLCLGEAIVSIRRGQGPEGVALLETNWLRLRDTFSANMMRVAEVVRAFGEAGGGVREYNVVGERLVRIAPSLPNEMAFLGARWPEMRAFLLAHDLVTP